MNIYLIVILAFIILHFILDIAEQQLNIKALVPHLPKEFTDLCNQEEYEKTQQYTKTNTRLSLLHNIITTPLTLLFILIGGFNTIDTISRSLGITNEIGIGIIFTGLLILLSWIIDAPFQLYTTFIIDEKFGLNKTTFSTYITDIAKTVLLTIVIGIPILAFTLWFFEKSENFAWLYCWIALTLFTVIIQFIAPIVIMPMFNKFTPIESGEIEDAIQKYAAKQYFAIEGIYTMDGSKRSSRLNAFFTGFGKFRRIVFFDTLLDKLTSDEIVAVLAHEMGHYKKRHTFILMVASIMQFGIMLFLLSMFIKNKGLFAAFGMEHLSVYASLVFFGFLYAPLSMGVSILFNIISRKFEYEADAFAVQTTDKAGAPLISGLKKLSIHNLANLTPHPLRVFLHYSHPPLLARIEAIKKLG